MGHAKSHTYPLVAFSLGSGFGSHFYGSFLAECADGIGVPGSLRLYSDRCADERSEPFFAREFLLEKAFLARRAGHASKSPRPTGSAGAFAVFPVVLFGEFENHSGCGAAGQRALQVSAEPGSFFAVGKHRVDWSLDLSQGQLRGHFTVTVSDKSAGQGDASCELVAPDGTTTQYSPPLPPLVLPALSPGRVNEAAGRLEVEAERARTDILRFSERLLRQVVTRLARQFTSQVDADDAHQLAAIECLRLAERFASPERPAVSWSRYVVLNANRAVARALERDGHFRRPERAVERLLEEHPELVGAPVEVVRAELAKFSSEAASWSDGRIAEALAGPPRQISLDHLGYDSSSFAFVRDTTSDVPVDLLLGSLVDEKTARVARPFLASEALLDDAEAKGRSTKTVQRSRRALVSGIAAAIGVKAETPRGLIEAFAEAGEDFENPADRVRMEERARAAVMRVMEGSS